MTRYLLLGALAALAVLAPVSATAGPIKADIVSIVDESGSMGGEHAWIGGMITSLESGLIAAGLTGGNNYGLTGFGNNLIVPRQFIVGGGQFGTAAQFAAATGSLVTNGGTEDGYLGIDFANNNYTYRSGAARNYILVTDEERDNYGPNALNYTNILTSLTSTNTLLNAVVNATFRCGDGTTALGISANGVGYKADGAGGFTTCTGAVAVSGFNTTIADYVNLALASGGAAWDLNQLRAGGSTATSFTNAFIDIKVEEITQQAPDGGATLSLLGFALIGLGAMRRKFSA